MRINMKRSTQILIPLLFAVSITACGDKDTRLASVDGKAISQAEFDSYLKFKRINTRDDKHKQSVIDQYLEREALAAAIEKNDVLDKALIDAELNEFRKEMFVSRYFETFLKEKVSEQAVQNYYSAHENDYSERKVHVAHILLRTNKNMGENEKKAKFTSAHAAQSQLKTGKKFEDVAKNYSEDAISAKKGGDLGWLKEGSIDKRFSDTVFAMKPGDTSEPFETSFGYHIVKLIEGPMVVKRPFDSVKGDIRYQLRNKAKDEELKRLKGTVSIKKQKND